jgi:hypothetical protein
MGIAGLQGMNSVIEFRKFVVKIMMIDLHFLTPLAILPLQVAANNKILRDFPRDARRGTYNIATLRPMAQGMINQYQRQHGLGNRRRTNANTGIVPPFSGYLNGIALTHRSSGAPGQSTRSA